MRPTFIYTGPDQPTKHRAGQSHSPQTFHVWNACGWMDSIYFCTVFCLLPMEGDSKSPDTSGRIHVSAAPFFFFTKPLRPKCLSVFQCLLLTSFRAFSSHGPPEVRAAMDPRDKTWSYFIDEEIWV